MAAFCHSLRLLCWLGSGLGSVCHRPEDTRRYGPKPLRIACHATLATGHDGRITAPEALTNALRSIATNGA